MKRDAKDKKDGNQEQKQLVICHRCGGEGHYSWDGNSAE